jgi:hypothetical protein
MSTLTADDVKSVLGTVQEKLAAKEKQSGIPLSVSSEASRQEDDWLYVVVAPTRQGIRAYDYVAILSEVERELHQQGLEHVLLVPAMPD